MSAIDCPISESSVAKEEPTEEDLVLLYESFQNAQCPRDPDLVRAFLDQYLLSLGWTMPLNEFDQIVKRWSRDN